MEQLAQDIRHSLRMFVKSPGFTCIALAALALGIGANTAIFSVVNTVLLKPLAYPDPDRIVQLMVTSPGGADNTVSVTKFNLWRTETKVFEDVSAYDFGAARFSVGSEQIKATHVSAGYFRLFGASVVLGRSFTANEDRPHGDRVVVISHNVWRRRFGGDPQTLGKTLSLSGEPYTVIGILAPGFRSDPPSDIWLPFQLDPGSSSQGDYFWAAARLRPGVTLAAANAQLQLSAAEFRRKYPQALGPKEGFLAKRLQDAIIGGARLSLLLLTGAVGFVLLIACANVASLLLARAAGRQREISIRAAVGAGRGRIIRQLLTESVLLAMVGGSLGIGLGMIGVRVLLSLNAGHMPRVGDDGAAVTLDWQVLLFTTALSLGAGILFGLFPALEASRADLTLALKGGGLLRQSRARAILVTSEVALALILLIGASLLIRTFIALRSVDRGFDTHNVLTTELSLTGPRFVKTAAVADMIRGVTRRLESLPGVMGAASTSCIPLECAYGLPFIIAGRPLDGGPAHGESEWRSITARYFDVFRIAVLRGRRFTERDTAGSSPVAMINQTMARRFWGNGDPLRDRIVIGSGVGPEFTEGARQIVGIVGDTHDDGLDSNPQPMMYIPADQVADSVTALNLRMGPLPWIVRTRTAPLSMRSSVESALRQATGGLPVRPARTMEEVVARSTARQDFDMSVLTFFGGAALLLAAIGIYGLMAYSIEQRTREIGIRMALGAQPGSVRNMILWQGLRLSLLGVGLGIPAALGLSRLMSDLLFGVQPWDAFVFGVVPAVLFAVALLAVWIPARRATRIDPMVALRCD